MKKLLFPSAAWAALAAIIFVTVSPIGWRPQDILPVDVDRALAFALLAGLFVVAYPKHWALAAVLLVAGAGAIELLQLLSPTRHAHVDDAIVKAGGALLGVVAAMGFNLLRARLLRARLARGSRRHVRKPASAAARASMQPLAVKSSAISAVYFSAEDGRLRIRFHDGEERLFSGVSESDAQAFVTAPSPGTYYVKNIRKQFPRLAA